MYTLQHNTIKICPNLYLTKSGVRWDGETL